MKKVFVLGLCLATSVTVLSLKDTNSNGKNLGVATVVVNNQNLIAYEDAEAASTAALAKLAVKAWNKSCKEVARYVVYEVIDWISGISEESVANVELNDEMNSKLKTL
jgi:hypothetical protein